MGIAALAGVAGNASASGMALIEQNVSGLGNAYAGAAASAEDASTIFYNPAGLTRLKGTQLVFGGTVIRPSIKFHDQGSTSAVGTPLTGGDGGDAGDFSLVPNFYIAHAVDERLRVGLGINAPFGLGTDYEPDWKGRYQAVTSDFKAINFNPAIAYKVNDVLSLGAGVNLQYAEAELSNAIDFGSICFGRVGPGTCTALGLTPQNADGFVRLEGDDWSWGFNAGLLFEPSESTRIGLAYRSHVEHTLEGEADFMGAPTPLTMGGAIFVDTDASADITLPESVSLSGYHQLDPRWAIMADVTWTRWSRFQELRAAFDSAQPDSYTTENWDNTLRYSLGVSYAYTPAWTIRAGVAYDESPIPDDSFRTPRVPDNDRWWLALGLSYRASERTRFDLGYAHLFIRDTDIDHVNESIPDTLVGEYDSSTDIFGVQMTWQFK